jgi:phosphopantothenoylcysteine decarboxylase / phosphopantothenate---cysteine ligase
MDAILNANVLITCGPTHEYIDDVRFIGNPSTGRMGVELANAARAAGARVTVVCGPTHLAPPIGAHWIPVVSAQDMYEAVAERFDACEVFIAAAAVSDYRPRSRLRGKYKKGPKTITLELEKTTDILLSMGKRRRGDQTLVGYSLEVDDPVGQGRKKLLRKHCDLMVVNTPGHFGNSTEHVWIINRAGVVAELPPSGKDSVAATVIELVANLRRGETLPLVRTLEEE